ncbi:MAG: DMT family transporter, partial [Actinomycetota bacterium]
WATLALGLAAVAGSPIMLRLASDASPLALSFWRCGAGALVLAPFAARRVRATPARDLLLPSVAGVFLAVHFATWITSLQLTTVAASVLLVSTTPIFVALAARLLLKERMPRLGWAGILLAVGGAAVVGGADLGGSSLVGNALALIGGATAGGYVLAGGVSRQTLGILEYAVVTYAVAATLLLIACVLGQDPLWGYPTQTWGYIALIIIGPQLLGHTVVNFVLGDIDATTVSVALMVEPVIATGLAYLVFEELPSATVYPGGVAILLGIYLVTLVRRQPAVMPE